MRATHIRRAMAGTAIAVIGAVGVTSVASGKPYGTPKPGTIKIVLKGKGKKAFPLFTGPKSIQAGAKLTIVNTTKQSAIGPHTFTLIEKNLLPKGNKEYKACGEKFTIPVCLQAVKDLKANPDTGVVKRPSYDVGKKGWDTSYGKHGDSEFFPDKGATATRKVTAKAGTTLHYFCLVHPFMQGTIKVTK